MPQVLSRDVRNNILQRCLNNRILIKRCAQSEQLLGQSTQDLLDELGIKIYQSLYYYRFLHRLTTPGIAKEEQAYKLAITAGHNHLTSMVRTALAKGAVRSVSIDQFSEHHAHGKWSGAALPANTPDGASAVFIANLLAAVATDFVGSERAGLLLRATIYDWQGHCRLSVTQVEIMHGLGQKSRLQMRRLLEQYRERVRAELEPTPEIYLRIEGVWRAAAAHNAA